MYNIFFTIAGMVVILNLFLLLVPDGKYEKYVSSFAGVLIMLIFLTSFLGKKPTLDMPDFDAGVMVTENAQNLNAVAVEQWIEGIIATRINGEFSVKVYLNSNAIDEIEISANPMLSQEDLHWVAEQCSIEFDKFVLK